MVGREPFLRGRGIKTEVGKPLFQDASHLGRGAVRDVYKKEPVTLLFGEIAQEIGFGDQQFSLENAASERRHTTQPGRLCAAVTRDQFFPQTTVHTVMYRAGLSDCRTAPGFRR